MHFHHDPLIEVMSLCDPALPAAEIFQFWSLFLESLNHQYFRLKKNEIIQLFKRKTSFKITAQKDKDPHESFQWKSDDLTLVQDFFCMKYSVFI